MGGKINNNKTFKNNKIIIILITLIILIIIINKKLTLLKSREGINIKTLKVINLSKNSFKF